ncbi:hypothetical protein GQ457_04G004460 [Hibiscus cannabinus]
MQIGVGKLEGGFRRFSIPSCVSLVLSRSVVEFRSAIYKSPFFEWWSRSLLSSYTPLVPSEFYWTSSLVKLVWPFLGLFTLFCTASLLLHNLSIPLDLLLVKPTIEITQESIVENPWYRLQTILIWEFSGNHFFLPA